MNGVMIRDGHIATVVAGRSPELPVEGCDMPECRPRFAREFKRDDKGVLERDERGFPIEEEVEREPDWLRFMELPDWFDFKDRAFKALVEGRAPEADLAALVERKDAERRAPEEAAQAMTGMWEAMKAKGLVSDDDLPEAARKAMERQAR